MKGAVPPIEASRTWPNWSWPRTRCKASRRRRVSCESAWPRASSVPPGGVVSAASTSGRRTPSRSNAASCVRAPSSDGAAQNAGTARCRSRWTRRSSQPFQRMTTQALIDMRRSSVATLLLLMSISAWVVILWKGWLLRRVHLDLQRAVPAFWAAPSLEGARTQLAAFDREGVLRPLVDAALTTPPGGTLEARGHADSQLTRRLRDALHRVLGQLQFGPVSYTH